jgi:hypothetical protein
VGLTYSDNALFGKADSIAVPSEGQFAVAVRSDRFLVPGDACRRGTAFGYEPVRLELRQPKKKLRTVTGAAICRKNLALIYDRGMKRHKAKRRGASLRPSEFGFP